VLLRRPSEGLQPKRMGPSGTSGSIANTLPKCGDRARVRVADSEHVFNTYYWPPAIFLEMIVVSWVGRVGGKPPTGRNGAVAGWRGSGEAEFLRIQACGPGHCPRHAANADT